MEIVEILDNETPLSLYKRLKSTMPNLGLHAQTFPGPENSIILSITSGRRSGKGDYTSKYGNGSVFRIVGKEIIPICIPSKMCFQIRRDEIVAGEYVFYPIIDGTMINLYWFDGDWRMCTKHSIDVSDYTWRGIQYRKELDRVLLKYPQFSWDKLDREHTYSILFVSSQINPIMSGDHIYFISSQTNSTQQYCYVNTIGIESQQSFVDRNKISGCKYGVIFRKKNGTGHDYIWRTPKYSTIRNMLYNMPRSVNREYVRNHFKNTDFMILCNICCGKAGLLMRHVPKLKKRIIEMEENLKKIIHDAIDNLQSDGAPEYLQDFIDYINSTYDKMEPGKYPVGEIFASCFNMDYIIFTHELYNKLYIENGQAENKDREQRSKTPEIASKNNKSMRDQTKGDESQPTTGGDSNQD